MKALSSWLKNRLKFEIDAPASRLNTGVCDCFQVHKKSKKSSSNKPISVRVELSRTHKILQPEFRLEKFCLVDTFFNMARVVSGRFAFGLVSWIGVAFLVGCVAGLPAGSAEPRVDADLADGCITPLPLDLVTVGEGTVPVDADLRVVDRGIQSGLSKASGWPESCFKVAEAFLEPWPTDFSRKELIDSAMARTIEYMMGLPEDHPHRPLKMHFEPGFPSDHRSWIEIVAGESMKAIGEGVYPEGVHLIVGDSGYLQETLTELKPLDFVAGFCGNDDAPAGDIFFCAEDDIAMARFGRLVDQGVLSDNGLWTAAVPHEMFHTFQAFHREKGHTKVGSEEPRWMSEGSADFFGFAMAQYAGVSSYYVSVWDWAYYLPNPDLGLEEFEAGTPFSYPPEEYWMGQMATEYLVASLGFDVLLDIYREFGLLGDFEASFEAATGLALTDFYQKFDQAYQTLFFNNFELVEFTSRECPTYWDCSLFFGDPEFTVHHEQQVGTGEPNPLGDDWWRDWGEVLIQLPAEAENSDHGLPLFPETMPPDLDCLQINKFWEWESGIASSFESRGASDMHVSTQWYVFYQYLDLNQDGVVCGPGDSG